MADYQVPGVFIDTYESFVDEVEATSPAEAEVMVRERHLPRSVMISRDLIVETMWVVGHAPPGQSTPEDDGRDEPPVR